MTDAQYRFRQDNMHAEHIIEFLRANPVENWTKIQENALSEVYKFNSSLANIELYLVRGELSLRNSIIDGNIMMDLFLNSPSDRNYYGDLNRFITEWKRG